MKYEFSINDEKNINGVKFTLTDDQLATPTDELMRRYFTPAIESLKNSIANQQLKEQLKYIEKNAKKVLTLVKYVPK